MLTFNSKKFRKKCYNGLMIWIICSLISATPFLGTIGVAFWFVPLLNKILTALGGNSIARWCCSAQYIETDSLKIYIQTLSIDIIRIMLIGILIILIINAIASLKNKKT